MSILPVPVLTTTVTKSEYIDIDDICNVYMVELTAIQMAIEFFKVNTKKYINAFVFTDSQSAIQAVESLK